MRNELARDVSRFERDGRVLVDTLRTSLDMLGIEKKRLDSLDPACVCVACRRGRRREPDDVAVGAEKHFAQLQQEIDLIGGRFDSLSAQADELAQKQAGLDALHDRLMVVEDLAKQTSIRYDMLRQSRADLEALRRDIHDLHKGADRSLAVA
jgi:hypothetical protein